MGFIINEGVLVKFTGYEDNCTDIVVPDGVKEIRFNAFNNFSKISSVVLPEGIERIGSYAFHNCSGIKQINLPNSLKIIESSAFQGCSSLAKIHIPDEITTIAWKTFEGCSGLTSIIIPSYVTSIGNDAFSGCSGLTSIIIPNSVTNIGPGAFNGCTALKYLSINNENAQIGDAAFKKCNGLADSSGMIIVNNQLHGYVGTSCNVIVPDGLTEICSYAFAFNKTIQTINLPDSVTRIGERAFEGCALLEEFVFPSYVTDINDEVFASCTNLKRVVLPKTLVNIGYSVFGRCSQLYELLIDENNLYWRVSGNVLHNSDTIKFICRNANIMIGDDSYKIDSHAICGKNIYIDIPQNITFLTRDAFADIESGFIYIASEPGGINEIYLQPNVGIWCWKTYSDVPATYRSNAAIGFATAVSKNMKDVEHDYSGYIKYIKSQKKKIYLSSLENSPLFNLMISEKIFDSAMVDELLDKADKMGLLDKKATLLDYQNTNIKKKKAKTDFFDIDEKPKSIAEIKKEWTYEVNQLGELCLTSYKGTGKEIYVPGFIGKDPIVAIGSYCFSPDKPRITASQKTVRNSIEKIILPDNLLKIYQGAFSGCSFLKEITVPSSVQTVERLAFADCTHLESVNISENTSFGGSFIGCKMLMDKNGMVIINHKLDSVYGPQKKKIIIPKGVTEIGHSAFETCVKLTEIHIPSSVTTISYMDFRNSNGIRIPVTIFVEVGSYAEEYCKKYGFHFVTE